MTCEQQQVEEKDVMCSNGSPPIAQIMQILHHQYSTVKPEIIPSFQMYLDI